MKLRALLGCPLEFEYISPGIQFCKVNFWQDRSYSYLISLTEHPKGQNTPKSSFAICFNTTTGRKTARGYCYILKVRIGWPTI